MTATVELPKTRGPGSGLDDNWRVIVLNDDHNTFDGVASALARIVPGITLDQGYAGAEKSILWAAIFFFFVIRGGNRHSVDGRLGRQF